MVVLVCGGRDYRNTARLFEVMDRYAEKFKVDVLVHGAASGADELAGAWAANRGVHVATVAALWGKHGKSAGPKRNRAMLALKPEAVIAFPGGAGTDDMCRAAEAAGVKVYRIANEPSYREPAPTA